VGGRIVIRSMAEEFKSVWRAWNSLRLNRHKAMPLPPRPDISDWLPKSIPGIYSNESLIIPIIQAVVYR